MQPRKHNILGLSLLPAPLWHLSVVLYILSQLGIFFTAVMFVCFLTVVFGVLFNTSCMTFLTQINFGAVDWKRSCRSSSTPK